LLTRVLVTGKCIRTIVLIYGWPRLSVGCGTPTRRRNMRTRKFGVSLPLGGGVPAAAQEAERLGFDYVTCGEHIAFHEPSANAFVTLAAAAGATRDIGLFSAVTLVPLYPAGLLAKLVAAMDNVTGGRFTLGIGVGGENPVEFDAAGVAPRERGARTDEALELLGLLLGADEVTFNGRFTSVQGLTIAPRPSAGRVPIWVAGRSEAAIGRAVRFGDGWMPYLFTPERLRAGVERLEEGAAEVGRAPGELRVGVHLFTTVMDDGRAARKEAVDVVSRTYNQDFGPLADKYLLHGSPARCRERLAEYRDAGADTFLFRLAAADDQLSAMMRRVAEEVVAPLRDPISD
jgi:probable F420-dependent oxidoreductase